MPQNIVSLVYRKVDLGVTGQVASAAPCALLGFHLVNAGSGVRYVKLYNKATAPTEADTPVLTLSIAATGHTELHGVWTQFSAGLSARATTGLADNDTGAPTAGDVTINLFYAT